MATFDLGQPEFWFRCRGFREDTLRVFRFRGRESISQPFEFTIELVSDARSLDLQSPIGQSACLTLLGRRADGRRYHRYVHGVIERFVQTSAGVRHSRYRATLVPALKSLHYRRTSRIFQEQTIVEVARRVLTDGRISGDRVQTYLQSTYGNRNYCVQYQESDLNFISRLWEEEGLFYFFEHTESQEILNLGDGRHAFGLLTHYPSVQLRERLHLYEEGLSEFSAETALYSGSALLRDYRFQQPALDMHVGVSGDRFTEYSSYHFPGEFVDPAIGQRLAHLRLQEQQCQGARFSGAGNVRELLPGYKFTLAGHLRDDCNQEYVVLSVEHEGTQPQALAEEGAGVELPQYGNRIEFMPSSTVYRPPRRAVPPCIAGIQTAVVVGPPGEEIHCDSHGRVKVQFHWDQQGTGNDYSSCWIRVNQPWAGTAHGGIFLPRVGQEVLVQFLEGDPDRPVIVGRVYNGENLPPYALPANKSISTIKTASTPGGDGSNELRFEDAAGAEEIYLHGQLDMNTVIERDRSQHFGRDTSDHVGRNRDRTVVQHESIRVGGNREAAVAGQEALQVGGNQSLDVGANQTIAIGANQTLRVAARQDTHIAGSHVLKVDAAHEVKVVGNQSLTVGKSRTTHVTKDESLIVGGAHTVKVDGGLDGHIKGPCKLTVSAGPFELKSERGKQTVESDGPITIKSNSEIKLLCGAGSITIERSGNIVIKGPLVKINC